MPVRSKRNRKRKPTVKRKNPFAGFFATVTNAWLSISWARIFTLCTIAAVSVCVYVATLWAMTTAQKIVTTSNSPSGGTHL